MSSESLEAGGQQERRAREGAAPPKTRDGFVFSRLTWHVGFTLILTIVGAVLGYRLGANYIEYLNNHKPQPLEGAPDAFNLAGFSMIGGLLGLLLASTTFRQIMVVGSRIESMENEDKVAAGIGAFVGLMVAVLLTPMVGSLPYGDVLTVLDYTLAVSICALLAIRMKKEVLAILAGGRAEELPPVDRLAKTKLLDTNVIIDGRLLDVWNSGFIEGELLVPQFVLDELQLIADSADDLKRARGRRGLDLLNQMKDEVAGFRILNPKDYPVDVSSVQGVDHKLIKLASFMDAALVTNDYNLNKVADVQGIPVLNLNRLALAMKPVVIAGEQMKVNIIRSGRDPGQGVAYLDDGTMVVVEDGESKIGQIVEIEVTSLLQTVAGKMIFAQLRDSRDDRRPTGRGGSR